MRQECTRNLVDFINNNKLNDEQKVLVLYKASIHPLVRHLFKSAALIDVADYKVKSEIVEQMGKSVVKARKTNKKEGRTSDERRSFSSTVLLASMCTPEAEGAVSKTKRSSISAKARVLKFPVSSCVRIARGLNETRTAISTEGFVKSWGCVKSRHGFWQKLSEEDKSYLRK